ncbi:MAG: CD225/dispanin family protein [Acidobacteriota bacterium]
MRPPIPNYLVQSILVTLCCCLPLGVVAIIYAAQVNSKLSVGDLPGAMASSRSARMWCWIGFAGGALVSIVYAVVMAANIAGSK